MQINEAIENLNLKVLHLQRQILLLKKSIRERDAELDIKISRIEVDLEELNKFFAQLDITEEVDISGHYSSQIP